MTQNFPIKTATPMAIAVLAAVAAACWLLAYVVATALRPLPIVAVSTAAMCVGLGLLFAWFAMAQRWSSVTLKERQLNLHVPLFSRVFSIQDIVEESPSKVDLQRDGAFRLTWRTYGLSVPGYHLGWFRTQGAGEILAAVTGKDAVTWKTKGGDTVLVSVADADAFLAALQQASSSK